MPGISVVIPTYNRAPLLAQAVESVLQQTISDLELIVVDDGSTDETPAVMSALMTDSRVRYISQPNAGRSVARNHGASLARGEYLGFLDSDDRYLPNCLAAHLGAIEEFPETGLTVGGYDYINETGSVIGERRPWLECEDLSLSGWLFNCLAMPGSILVRRHWFDRAGGFDRRCEIAEDWDIFLRLALQGCRMCWAKSIVCQYRQHTGNSFRTLTLHHQGSLRAFEKLTQRVGGSSVLAEKLPQAMTQLHLLFARRALNQSELTLAEGFLRQAVQTQPELTNEQRNEMAEFVLSGDDSERVSELSAEVLALVQKELTVSEIGFRKAQARVFMKRYFQAQRSGKGKESMQYLKLALKLDPLWLGNRGVVVNVIRYYLKVA